MVLTSSQSILEDLLETQELEDAQVNCWVQAETTLVWTQSRVELNTVSAVHLELSLVIFPDNTELDNALRDRDNLQGSLIFGLLLEEGAVFEG